MFQADAFVRPRLCILPVAPPPCSFDSPHSATQSVFADRLSNPCFSPFLSVVWQGDPIPEDIYEILGGSSVRSISDLQRALRIDSVGKSPLHQTLLYFFLTLWGAGWGYRVSSGHTTNRPHYKYRYQSGAKAWLFTHLAPLKPGGVGQPDAFLGLLLTAWSSEGHSLPKTIEDGQSECKELGSALFTWGDAWGPGLELARDQFSRWRKKKQK